MKLAIINGDVVTGDRETILKNTSIVIENGIIQEVGGLNPKADKIINATGQYVLPGLINNHAHRMLIGPTIEGAGPIRKEKVLADLADHLLSGTTTLQNVDGFQTMEELKETQKYTSMNLKTCTAHVPHVIEAVKIDAKYSHELAGTEEALTELHCKFTAEMMLKLGATCIGEIGTHAHRTITLRPALMRASGSYLTLNQVAELKMATIGKNNLKPKFDYNKTKIILERIGLADKLSVEKTRKVLEDCILRSQELMQEGIREAGKLAKKLDVPIIVHHDATRRDVLFELADMGIKRMIAAHCNSGTNKDTRELKQKKVIIDMAIGACLKPSVNNPLTMTGSIERQYALLKEDLVDIISTDWGGGYWDTILAFFEKAVKNKVISLPKAISLATSNVVEAIPKLAPNRGLIAEGKVADVIITDNPRISHVDKVIIGGRVVVEHYKIVPFVYSF